MIISPPEKTYRQTLTLRIMAFLAPALAWTVALIIWADEPSPGPISMAIAIALTALWVLMCVLVSKAQLTIHPEGMQRQTSFGVTEMRWEVSETRFTQVPVGQQAALHFGLFGAALFSMFGKGGSSGQRTLVLHATDGHKLKVTPNWKDSEDAIRIALARVDPRIKDEMRRLQGGDTLKFGNVSLSQRGVAWKEKEPIPFNRLVKCQIGGTNLRIKEEGKWLDNISVNTSKVPNVLVLLDLIGEFRAGGKPSQPDPLARAGA